MDISEIKKLVSMVERANIEEIEIEEEGRRIRIRKSGGTVENPVPGQPAILQVPSPTPAPPPSWPTAQGGALVEGPGAAPEEEEALTIKSPMIGTFYRAASPDAPSFVSVGDQVKPDTIVCILEAMKTMNEVKAGIEGRISEILVENGAPVEYGQGLFKITVH